MSCRTMLSYVVFIVGLTSYFNVYAASAANAFVSVSSSTYGVEDIVPISSDFYLTTRDVCAPLFMADIGVWANTPYYLIKPERGRLRLGIAGKGEYKVKDESGNEDVFSGWIHVLKLDIELDETNVCWKSSSCKLQLTNDSFPGGTVVWSSSPDGISGEGNSITFNPCLLPPGEYMVTACSGIVPSYKDTCLVRVTKIEFVTPNGDPILSPVVSGDGQNEFTYTTAMPGVLNMNLKAIVTPASATSKIRNCRFNVSNIGSSIKNWAVNNPDGNAIAGGSYLTASVTFTGLPNNNSDFGEKRATIYWQGIICDTKRYEVFFPKTGENHPGGQANSPNWYYYWQQTSANLANTTMKYLGALRSYYAYTDNRTIYIANDASLSQIPIWGSPKGIDCFAWTTAHESKHHSQTINFWPTLWVNENDTDKDWLPNDQEASYMPGRPYSPTNPTTYNDAFGYGEDPLRDCEDINLRSQSYPYSLDVLWHNGSADREDWANPGKQSRQSY